MGPGLFLFLASEAALNASAPTPNPRLPYWWMLTGAMFFSGMAICIDSLKETVPWQTIALVRTTLAFLIAAGMTWFGGAKFVVFRPLTLWVRSLAGSCSLALTFYALTHSQSVSQVIVLSQMFPVWVALLSWPVLGTFPSWDAWLAIACGVAGVVIIQQPSILEGELALAAAAAGAFTSSIALLGLHRLKHLDPRSIVAHFSGVSVIFCLALAWLLPQERATGSIAEPRVVLLLLGVGVTATIGQLFLTKAFAAGSPSKVSVVSLSQVGITAIFDAMNERYLTMNTTFGMLLIVLPTAWLLVRGGSPGVPPVVPKEEPIPPPIE